MKKRLILGLILLLSIFMRFFRFVDLFHWSMDEDFWSYLPYNIATGYHFPLISGHIAGTGLYAGPTFIYLMAIPTKIFAGNPLGFGVIVSGLGVITTVLIYLVVKKMLSEEVAIFSSLIYAGSFLMSIFDRHYWNASLTPILSLLAVWCLWQIISGKLKFALPLSLILTLAFHAHGTGMALLLFAVFSWIFFRLPLRNKTIVVAIGLFFLLQLPLVLFDLRHNLTNVRALASYLKPSDKVSVTVSKRLENITTGFISAGSRLVYFPARDLAIEQTLGLPAQYEALKAKPPVLSILSFIGVMAFSLVVARKNKPAKLLLLLIISTLIGLLIYKEKIPEYFFNPTFVPVIILAGLALASPYNKPWGKEIILFGLVVFTLANVANFIFVKHTFSFDARMKAVKNAISLVSDKPFILDAQCKGFCELWGLRYFFTYLGHEPVSSYNDGNFSWLYDQRVPKVKAAKKLTFYMHDSEIVTVVEDLK